MTRSQRFEAAHDLFALDGPPSPPPPRRSPILITRVGQAMRADLIDAIDARALLDLSMQAPLPEMNALAQTRRAPLADLEARALRHASVTLWRAFPERSLRATRPQRTAQGWALDVMDDDQPDRVIGRLTLTDRFEVIALPELPAIEDA